MHEKIGEEARGRDEYLTPECVQDKQVLSGVLLDHIQKHIPRWLMLDDQSSMNRTNESLNTISKL